MSETRDTRDMRNDAAGTRDVRGDTAGTRDMRSDTARRESATDRPMEARTDMPMRRQTAERTDMMWPEMGEFHRRFHDIESEFIENPKDAVRKAEQLMKEMVESLTRSMRDRMQSMHRDVDGKDGDTEMLRQTMVGYRTWIDSMGGHRAA